LARIQATVETDGGGLPAFVRDEFEAYFRCGILTHGFLRVRFKGDVLISINGMSLTTPEQVLDPYGKLKTTRQLNLGLVRTGGRRHWTTRFGSPIGIDSPGVWKAGRGTISARDSCARLDA
jgi:hypothetical protein